MLQHRRITTAVALTTAAIAAAPGAAGAYFGNDLNPTPATPPSVSTNVDLRSPDARDATRGDSISQTPSVDLRAPDTRDVAIGRGPQVVVTPPVVHYVSDAGDGFNWGDAGIGAGGAIALVLLATGGVMLVTHRRGEHIRSSGPSALAH